MSCLTNFDVTAVSLSVLALWAVSGLVLIWVARSHRFAGKPAFILTFAAMLWWLFTVAADLASVGLDCKVAWSLAAWPGIALLPIAWAFFLFDYTLNPDRHSKRRRPYTYIGVPPCGEPRGAHQWPDPYALHRGHLSGRRRGASLCGL